MDFVVSFFGAVAVSSWDAVVSLAHRQEGLASDLCSGKSHELAWSVVEASLPLDRKQGCWLGACPGWPITNEHCWSCSNGCACEIELGMVRSTRTKVRFLLFEIFF